MLSKFTAQIASVLKLMNQQTKIKEYRIPNYRLSESVLQDLLKDTIKHVFCIFSGLKDDQHLLTVSYIIPQVVQ